MKARVVPQWWLGFSVNDGRYTVTAADFSGNGGVLSPGERLAIDWLGYEHGWLRWVPHDASHLVPRNVSVPAEVPAGEYKLAARVPVLVQGVGLAAFTSTANTVRNAIESWHASYLRAPEAATCARVYTIEDAVAFHLRHRTEAYHRPRLRPCGWIPRRLEVFGPPLIPASQQRLTASVDRMFDDIATTGDVSPPPRSDAASARWDDEDDDAA
jgi:hypothetical protein